MKNITLATLALVAVSLPALASPPSACSRRGLRSSYESGKEIGRRAIEHLWQNFGDETRMEEFMTRVTKSLKFEGSTSDFVWCGNTGYADGVFEALNAIRLTTSGGCLHAGTAAGKTSGQLLCGMMGMEGGTEGPGGLCESSERIACEAALRSTVETLCRERVSDDELEKYTKKVCGRFAS